MPADRLEPLPDGTMGDTRKLYRHPWGFIAGCGAGEVLTPTKDYFEQLNDQWREDAAIDLTRRR